MCYGTPDISADLFPEIILLWCVPAGFLLVFGGWLSEDQLNAMFKEDKEGDSRGDVSASESLTSKGEMLSMNDAADNRE